MEINIDKSQVMRLSRSNESLQIKANDKELEEVDRFKYLGSVLTRDGYCTREIKMIIAIANEAFNRKMSLLTSKLNIELKKKLVRCYVWSIVLWLRDMDTKKIGTEVFGELRNVVLEENGEDKMVRESN